MGNVRKTKKQKIRASERRETGGFKIKEEWLAVPKKTNHGLKIGAVSDKKYFSQDLTKTFVLTMLVLALELALWHYLS